MIIPLLPPDEHFHNSRDRWAGPGSRRKARHASSLDLHEVFDEDNSLRPDPVWMAIRHTTEWVARFQVVRAFRSWLDRPEKVESTSTSRTNECRPSQECFDTGSAPSGSGTAF